MGGEGKAEEQKDKKKDKKDKKKDKRSSSSGDGDDGGEHSSKSKSKSKSKSSKSKKSSKSSSSKDDEISKKSLKSSKSSSSTKDDGESKKSHSKSPKKKSKKKKAASLFVNNEDNDVKLQKQKLREEEHPVAVDEDEDHEDQQSISVSKTEEEEEEDEVHGDDDDDDTTEMATESERTTLGIDDDEKETVEEDSDDDEDVDEDGLRPIPPPNNPPMEKIRLIFKMPNTEDLRWPAVDPANTNLRMVREFLTEKYYRGNHIPRWEQRQLLYRLKPIFDTSGDYNVDDAKTLADHGITKDMSEIRLQPMHINVIAPSTKQAMVINNVDPMNDVIFEMRKLALADGYPIEKLCVLHKENGNAEILKKHSDMTFFNCGVKHMHTLELEWPKITLKVKLPVWEKESETMEESSPSSQQQGQEEIVVDDTTGRKFRIVDFTTQAELDKVQQLHDFVTSQTDIPKQYQNLLVSRIKNNNTKTKPKLLANSKKVLADYKVQDNDIIELKPMTIKLNLVVGGGGGGGDDTNKPTSSILDDVYPNDTVESIKIAIEEGRRCDKNKKSSDDDSGDNNSNSDGIPSIPKTSIALRKTKDSKELTRETQRLFKTGIRDGDELDVEKTKITIKVKLPEGKSGNCGGQILDFGVNPKLDNIETIQSLLSEKTGVPIELLPPMLYNGEPLDASDEKKTIEDHNMVENDVISIEPIKLNVNLVGSSEPICINDIDPFNDTIDDIKNRLGPNDMDMLPVEKQRLLYMGEDLDGTPENVAGEGEEDDSSGNPVAASPSSLKIFQCKIKDMDTIDLEKSRIDVTIKQPNGDELQLENVDPRKDSIEIVEEFLSREYYNGKDKDGTIPEDQLRPLKFDGEQLTSESKTKSLKEFGIVDDGQVIEMEPATVHVEFGSTTTTLENIDPMQSIIYDIKELGCQNDEIPLQNLVLLHKEANMSEIEERLTGSVSASSFYDHGIKDGDTLVIKRKPILLTIKAPIDPESGEDADMLTIKAYPDEDNFVTIHQKIADELGYPGHLQKLYKLTDDNDTEGMSKEELDAPGDTKLSSPELCLVEDCTIELKPVVFNFETRKGDAVSLQVSPSDTIASLKERLAKTEVNIPSDNQRLLMENGVEIGGDEEYEDTVGSDESALAGLGIKDGDTFVVEKGKITVNLKLPHGKDDTKVFVDPKKDDFDAIRRKVADLSRYPLDSQKLYKVADDGSKDKLEAPGDMQLSSPELDLVDDCTIELEPMKLNVKTERGDNLKLTVSPSDTITDVKKKLAKKVKIPFEKLRLLMEDGAELGGSEVNENSVGCDKSTLADLNIRDSDSISVEKGKIELTVKMPHGKKEINIVVDPKNDTVDEIRNQIFDATGLPKKYQQRIRYGKELMDNGHKGGNGGEEAELDNPQSLAKFDLKEHGKIMVDATRIYVKRIPAEKKNEEPFLIQNIDPMNHRLQDLKTNIASKAMVAAFKQRLLNPETDEEYVGNKDSTEKIHEYGIQDGDLIHMELAKLNLRIVLPARDTLDLTVDPRKDDVQKVRDFVFKKYYKSRKLPEEDIRPMTKGRKDLNKEPGEVKLIEFGIMRENDYVTLKPCCLQIETPARMIFCPNADPFHDTLHVVEDFVKHLEIDIDGCHVEFKKMKMTDYKSVLYDLNVRDDDILVFKK